MKIKPVPRPIIFLIFIGLVLVVQTPFNRRLKNSNRQRVLGQAQIITSQGLRLPDLSPAPIKRSESAKAPVLARRQVVLDVNSANLLDERNGFESVPIASLTKIMTGVIALEQMDLDQEVRVSKNAASQIGHTINLQSDERVRLKDLLKGLLIASGNDAAMAIAEHYGSPESFVKVMNDKASQLGLDQTVFADPAGLNDDQGRSSARDIALLLAYALKKDLFRQIVTTTQTTIYSIDGQISHKLETSNRLIDSSNELYYAPSIGGKTGFTLVAGHSLAVASEVNGRILVTVVLDTFEKSPSASAKSAKALFEWASRSFDWPSFEV